MSQTLFTITLMFNFDTCRFCVWGFKSGQDSFRYIHEAFYKALKAMLKDVLWLDETDDISQINFENTFFISMEYGIAGMPRRQDCFYAIHNVESQAKEYFAGFPMMNYGLFVSTMVIPSNAIELARDTYFFPQAWEQYDSLVFRWGTNLLPEEIEANKPTKVFREDSKVINYIGCSAGEWGQVLQPFGQACWENGILFRTLSGVSSEDHVRLIKESYMAPSINIPYQTEVGYIPCRVFKAISSGHYPVTNNRHVYNFFQAGIYDPDSYDLFYDAMNYLPSIKLSELHKLMDEVAKNHTYLNKIDALLKAAKISQELR